MANDNTVAGQTGGSEAAVPSTEPNNIDPNPTVEEAEGTDTPTSSLVRNRAYTYHVWNDFDKIYKVVDGVRVRCQAKSKVPIDYRWPISTRPASPTRSPLFGLGPSPSRPGSMRARAGPARISGSGSDRKLGTVG